MGTLLDINSQTERKGNLLNRGVKNITNLRIGWSEVPLIDFRKFPEVPAHRHTSSIRLRASKAGYKSSKFMRER